MRITIYTTELDKLTRHNVLVKEKSFNYTSLTSSEAFNHPIEIVHMMNNIFNLSNKAEEYMYMLALDIKGRLLGIFEVSHGAVNYSIANPREIFVRALLCGAATIIVTHNHPSGDAMPSEVDIRCTKQIIDAGKIIGVDVIDHIIVGCHSYFSFREEKMI